MTMMLDRPQSHERRPRESELAYVRRVGACRSGTVDMNAEGFPQPLGEQAFLCAMCPVRTPCLNVALTEDPEGEWSDVWGGLTGSQRRALHFKRERVHCPGCGSEAVMHNESSEICLGCGISWYC